MEYRTLGRTGLKVSALAFGCGDVGGLMVRGTPAERERGVARAIEHGINYLDTAPAYGSGESEKNLGQVLRALKPTAIVGTKWRLAAADLADVPGAVARSVETSLGRLGLERVDLLHLHNLVGRVGEERPLGVARVLEAVVPAVRRLQEQGKVRFFGITASGETGALHRALSSGAIDTAQVVFNLLNPTGAYEVPTGFPAQDYDRLLLLAREQGVGTIGIRAVAGGALSGQVARHPTAIPSVSPIASGPDYATDVARARALEPLVAQGHAGSLIEAALRFTITGDAMSTVQIGCSDLAQLDFAAAAVNKGPLSPAALAALKDIWGSGLGKT
ncbi:MAG TPA: aldo/keto reductase [Methylomirabilota bacterium]|jgi:L-galactose dehydrogenase/L-glyceraldehyde 3-phosphate reductase|nr:aldo/keto reductase [Methylomirabilota bacterium]